MEITQMLLGPQVNQLQEGFSSLHKMIVEDVSSDTPETLQQVEKSLRQVEKLRDCLLRESNCGSTLQVLYLNFRDLKLKYRTALRQFRRRIVMDQRTAKVVKRKTADLVTVAA